MGALCEPRAPLPGPLAGALRRPRSRVARGKEAGLRVLHALASLLGALGAMAGTPYPRRVCLGLMGVLVVFLNVQSMRSKQGTELTSLPSPSEFTTLAGVLCGIGHTITPAWPWRSSPPRSSPGRSTWRSSGIASPPRGSASAVLLGILAFAVYPVLPDHPVDPWGLIEPRAAWLTVLLIAADRVSPTTSSGSSSALAGIEFAGFLGGLVN